MQQQRLQMTAEILYRTFNGYNSSVQISLGLKKFYIEEKEFYRSH